MTRGQLHTLVVTSGTMNHRPAAISLPITFFGFAAVIYLAVFIIPVARCFIFVLLLLFVACLFICCFCFFGLFAFFAEKIITHKKVKDVCMVSILYCQF